MAMQTAHDIPLLITSENSSSERRVTPAWSIAQFKTKLEPITGIPPSAQRLTLRVPGQGDVAIQSADDEATQIGSFPLVAYGELHVLDTRPPNARPNFNDPSVQKYVMPTDEYEKKTDSVLAWKKAHQLGRFDPSAPTLEAQKRAAVQAEIDSREITVGKRCRVGGDDSRRGVVMYVGEVPEIPGGLGAWVGVRLDEPVGKNDGSVGGKRYWGEEGPESGPKFGVFVRPERVEVGEFPVVDEFDEDLEEI